MVIYIYSSEPVRTLIFCNSKRTVDELDASIYIYISLPASPAQGEVSSSPRRGFLSPWRGFLFPMARSSSSPETPDSSNATSKLAGRPTAVTVYDYCPKTYNVRIQCRTSPLLGSWPRCRFALTGPRRGLLWTGEAAFKDNRCSRSPSLKPSQGERLRALVAASAEMAGPLHLGGRMNFNSKPNGSTGLYSVPVEPTSLALNFMRLPRCIGPGTSA